ncbi:type 1 fimbrial protein [Pseudomonas sp. B21-040]|uniref:fimbrial protein n=1 Tax=Pseudomonas sp. B21-040 TaxID=2895486 RepID=UPI00215E7D91|nr:fimbrial protein [Pseudomonas sp. B21-040]UVL43184.1 type 1 fimbrial protein [Pseudomonas sp. B21-040]
MNNCLNVLSGSRRTLSFWVLLLGLLLPHAAQAASTTCIYPNNPVSTVLQFNSPVTTAGSKTLNTVLQSTYSNPGLGLMSSADNVIQTATVNGPLAPGFTNVYKTNLNGIGIKFQATYGWLGGFSDAPFTTTFSKTGAGGGVNYVQAQLVVIGPIQSGILTALPSMTISYSGDCSNSPSVTWSVADGTVINALTCAVSASSKNLSVPLGIVKTSEFGASGSTAGNANFSIALENCSTGINLFATFTDANNPGNTSNVLSLTNDSQTASGVGIRLLTGNGATVRFGPDSYLPGTLNQMTLGPSSIGTVTLPFTASYVKTSNTITSGIANGIVTFTLSYQ